MRRLDRRSFLAVSAGVLAAPALAGAAAHRGAPGAAPGETFFTWTELRAGIHSAVDATLGGNCMVVTSAGEALLVDTKFPAFAAALAREAQAFGGSLVTIVNTHHHGDHSGGNAVLNAGARIVAHETAAQRIRAQFERYVQMARGGPKQVEMERAAAERVLEEAQAAAEESADWTAESAAPDETVGSWPHEMACAEVKLTLHHFGAGHTDNDVVVHLPEANVVHAGDLCFLGSHPYFDTEGGVTCRGWSESVAKAIELCDAETVVVPGHGELTDREGLEAQKRYLDELWDRVGKEIRAGRSKDEISAMRWDFMEGLGRDSLRPRAIGAVYDEIRGA